MSVFLPDVMVSALTDVTPELLQKREIDLLLLDFDNTILPYTTDLPTEEMEAWLRRMQASEIRLCVLSNSKKDRVSEFCRRYGIDCITDAKKPFHRGINAALARFGGEKAHTALAGDVIFTDVAGANSAGLLSVWVPSICNHTLPLRLRHLLEVPFLRAAKRRLRRNGAKNGNFFE